MLTLTEISNRLKDRNISAVARATEISRTTLHLLRDNAEANPEYQTIAKLSDYFEEQEK